MAAAPWDLNTLIAAAEPQAARPERHLWLVRLVQWLRQGELPADTGATPLPVLRLRLLLNRLERQPDERDRILAMLARLWREADVAALFADAGFSPRRGFGGELTARLQLRLIPATPDTDDLSTLFRLMFTDEGDAHWLSAIDAVTLGRLAALFSAAWQRSLGNGSLGNGSLGHEALNHGALGCEALGAQAAGSTATAPDDWRGPLVQAMTWLVSAIRAAAFAPLLRQRMAPELLASRPFDQLVGATQALTDAVLAHDQAAVPQHATYLRALLQHCRGAANSVRAHLEEHGISVGIVFEVQQLIDRTLRLEALVDLLLAEQPAPELQRLLVDLVRLAHARRSLRALLAAQYSLLARKVAERHAETGSHYITRNQAEYRHMLGTAAGGGAIIAGTTFAKFGVLALGLAPFWAGVGAGLNYAISFLIIHLLHWTVATKQPAMTAPALADKLTEVQTRNAGDQAAAVERFVDEITHLVRSQIAGIVGNLAAVAPLVLAIQGLAWWLMGKPLVSAHDAQHVLDTITLLGPTALFAAFTGVLLFASSLVAGWAENWFVYHRLHSALAYHPAMVARLGAERAARWAAWWRANISGLAANVSLGLLLGVVPVLVAFVGLPIEVRHVTLSTGQLAAAVSTLGWQTLQTPAFWWCVAGLVVTGVLNLGVSFWLALRVAMRSRGIGLVDRQRLGAALRRRLFSKPRSFLLPP